MTDLLDRIFEGLPAMRLRFLEGELDETDVRLLFQKAYSLGVRDTIQNQLDYWKQPKTIDER